MTLRQRAHSAHRNGQTGVAKDLYRKLLTNDCIPEDVGNLGSLLAADDEYKEAIHLYEKYIERWPSNYQLLFNAANLFIKINHFKKAINLLEQSRRINPNNLELLLKLTSLLFKTKSEHKAINILENFCQANPNEGLAWLELGVGYYRLEMLNKSLQAFTYGNKILPNHSGLLANRLTLYKDLSKINEAKDLYQSLSIKQKSNVNIRGAWAGLLLKMESYEEAIEILTELVISEPHIASHWINLAACQKATRHNLRCEKILKKGLIYNPDNLTLKNFLAQSLSESGNAIKAIKLLDAEKRNWKGIPDDHFFNIQFIGAASQLIKPELLSQIAKIWEETRLSKGIGPLWRDTIRENINSRKIRIAYLSSDFCNHPVGRFLLPLLETHDKSLFEIIGLHCGSKNDGITKLISSKCSRWINLPSVEDIALSRLISDLKIDAVIELGGYTAYSRIGALVYQPAPIQLSYLGYFAPTYLNSIDGWIGDKELFGGLSQRDSTQHPIYIEGGYMSFKPIRLPRISRTNNQNIRFGSFNNSRKFNQDCINLFTKIINQIPNSQMVIKSITFVELEEKERIYNAFIQAGLTSKQLIMLDWIEGTKAHMELYKWIDIALDPFPYGGATTTAEALWMGVPVITLRGKGMVGRLSSSILKSAQCSEWIAQDLSEYASIAKELAKLGPRNIENRQHLRNKVKNSDLGDGRRVSAQIENLIWKKIKDIK